MVGTVLRAGLGTNVDPLLVEKAEYLEEALEETLRDARSREMREQRKRRKIEDLTAVAHEWEYVNRRMADEYRHTIRTLIGKVEDIA